MSEDDSKDLIPYEVDDLELTGKGTKLYDSLKMFISERLLPDQHYGLVPKAKKPSLYKGGAQILAGEFDLIVPRYDEVRVTIDHEGKFYAYEYRASVIRRETGEVVAEGFGACNTNEARFRSEYVDKGFMQHTCASQARKRAYVDGIIQALRLSGIFTFSMEDLAQGKASNEEQHTDEGTFDIGDAKDKARAHTMAVVSELGIDDDWHRALCVKAFNLKESRSEMSAENWQTAEEIAVKWKKSETMVDGQTATIEKLLPSFLDDSGKPKYTGINDVGFLAVVKQVIGVETADLQKIQPSQAAHLISLLSRKLKAIKKGGANG